MTCIKRGWHQHLRSKLRVPSLTETVKLSDVDGNIGARELQQELRFSRLMLFCKEILEGGRVYTSYWQKKGSESTFTRDV